MLDGTAIDASAPVGIGLRAPHQAEILECRPALDFLEVHAENFMHFGPTLDGLLAVRRDYPISLHGVGLSLGSAEGIDRVHLDRFRQLIDRTEPMLVSEHLSWSVVDGIYLNDLLPLPYTEESLDVVAQNIQFAQEVMDRRLLIENPSRYLNFSDSTIPEAEFLSALVTRTGCAILCDVNNIYVSSHNVGEAVGDYLNALPAEAVHELHLAGHTRRNVESQTVLVDDHGSLVCGDVWAIYDHARTLFPTVPALIERDNNIPPLTELLAEAERARERHVVVA